MTLVAHLSGDLVLACRLCQHAGLVNRVRQRLLHVNVFAVLHRRHSNHCMGVVRRSNNDRVNIFLLFKHLSKITVSCGLGKNLVHTPGKFIIHIAKCHNIGPGLARADDVAVSIHLQASYIKQIAHSHTTDTYTGDVEHLTWRCMARPA